MERFSGEYIGTDLGAFTSGNAYFDTIANVSFQCVNREGGFLTPSWIQFETENKYTVGRTAKNSALIYPNLTVFNYKKYIGEDRVLIDVNGKKFTAKDLYVLVIKQMIEEAEADLNKKIKGMVIPVPAMYTDAQKKEVLEAGKLAGLEHVFLIIEPVAPFINYGVEKKLKGTICNLDLGGYTFDIAVAKVDKKQIDVTYVDGDKDCGGNNFTQALVDYVKTKYIQNRTMNPYDEQQLMQNVEQAKITLSKKEKARIFVSTEEGNQSITVTRKEFKECTKHLMNPIRAKLEKIKNMRIETIYLVGGSSKMLQFQELVKEMFPNTAIVCEDPEGAVVKGAAAYAQILYEGKETYDIKCSFVSTHSYGVVVQEGKYGKRKVCNMLLKDMPIPASSELIVHTKEENKKTVELELYESVNKEKFFDMQSGNHLRTVTLDIGGDLSQYSEIVIHLALDQNGTLQVHAKEPKWNTEIQETIEVK